MNRHPMGQYPLRNSNPGRYIPFPASRLLVAVLALAILVSPKLAHGQLVYDWSNTTNTNALFDLPENWFQNGIPGPSDHVRFASPDAYQVWWDNLTQAFVPSVGRLSVEAGNATFQSIDPTSQWELIVNGSPGGGAYTDLEVIGSSTQLTLSGIHLRSLGGAQVNDGATLNIDGSAASGSMFSVGGSAGFDGNVNVLAGGRINAEAMLAGDQLGSTGSVRITGPGSSAAANIAASGRFGSGSLLVEQGGLLTNQSGYVGVEAGSVGIVTVTGLGSQWLNAVQLNIGSSGNGTVLIEDGGYVGSVTTLLGSNPGGHGLISVSGAGSTLNQSGSFFVGYIGTGSLDILNGGAVSNGNGIVGRFGGSMGTVRVDGINSRWTNSGTLYVGRFGGGALLVENGGYVSSAQAKIGEMAGSNGQVLLTGSGSQWVTGDLNVAEYGTGALTVQSGAVVNSHSSFIGYEPGSSGEAVVNGMGSYWHHSGSLSIAGNAGSSGGNGSLLIADGGRVHVADSTRLWHAGSIAVTTGGVLDTEILNLEHGSFELLDGGLLHATTVIGDLTNLSGILAPGHSPGVTTIFGNYVQGAGATLQIELAGSTTGLFDQLFVTGDLFLDGYLDLQLQNGFSPDANQQFLIVDVGGMLTGQFSGLGEGDLVGSFAGRDFFVSYAAGDGNDIALFTAIPEPNSAVLAGFGLIGLAACRRRKCHR